MSRIFPFSMDSIIWGRQKISQGEGEVTTINLLLPPTVDPFSIQPLTKIKLKSEGIIYLRKEPPESLEPPRVNTRPIPFQKTELCQLSELKRILPNGFGV